MNHSKYVLRLPEIIFIVMILSGYVLNVLGIENAILIFLGLFGFITYYIFKAFNSDNDVNNERNTLTFNDLLAITILPKVICISIAVLILCIFITGIFEEAEIIMLVYASGLSLVVATLTLVVLLFRGVKQSTNQLEAVIRGVVISIILSLTFVETYF